MRQALPAHFKDTGCELEPSCLNCPFPQCLQELPRGKDRKKKEGRNEAMRAMAIGGVSKKVIAEHFGVSARTVARVKEATNEGKTAS